MLSISEAARRLDVSTTLLRKLSNAGELATIQTPYGRAFAEEDIEALATLRAARAERRGRPRKVCA